MRLTPLLLSLAILGMPGTLEAGKRVKKSARTTVRTTVKTRPGMVYKIRKGDTAAKVARTYNLSLDELGDLNPKVNLSRLSVGTVLTVKGSGPGVAKSPVDKSDDLVVALPATPVTPIPAIRSTGPAEPLHMEQLTPTSINPNRPRFVLNSARVKSPLPAEDLAPVMKPTAPVAEDPNTAELGFEPTDPEHLDFLWPVETRSVSSAWGPRMRTKTVRVVRKAKKKRNRMRLVKVRYQGSHKGVDLAAPMGTDIYAAQPGRVIVSERHPDYGNYIILDHGNGVQTVYAHNSLNIAQVGDIVQRGQKIAEIGSTGKSTGPHLHFEVRVTGGHRNPLPLLNDTEEISDEMIAFNQTVAAPPK